MNTNIKKICFSLLIMQCTLLSLAAGDDDDDSAFDLVALNKNDEDEHTIKETESSNIPAGEQRISEKSYAKIKSIREVLVKLLGSSRFTTAKDLSERYSDSQSSMQSLKETMIHEGDFIENSSESNDFSSIKKDDMKKLIASAVQETLMNNARPVQATVNTSSQPNTSPSFITPLFTPFQQPMNQNTMQPQQNMNMNTMQQPMNNFMQQPMNQMQQPMDQYNMYSGNNFSPQQTQQQQQNTTMNPMQPMNNTMQQPMDQYNMYPMNNTTPPAPQQSFMQTAQPFPATQPTQNPPIIQPPQATQTPQTPAPSLTTPVQSNPIPAAVPTVNPPVTPAQPTAAQATPPLQDVQYSDEGFPMDVPLDQIDQFLQQNDQANPQQ